MQGSATAECRPALLLLMALLLQTYLANNHHAVHLRPWELPKGKSPVGFTQG